MSIVNRSFRRQVLALAIAATLPLSAVADEKYDLLQQQVDLLTKQLAQVQETLTQFYIILDISNMTYIKYRHALHNI